MKKIFQYLINFIKSNRVQVENMIILNKEVCSYFEKFKSYKSVFKDLYTYFDQSRNIISRILEKYDTKDEWENSVSTLDDKINDSIENIVDKIYKLYTISYSIYKNIDKIILRKVVKYGLFGKTDRKMKGFEYTESSISIFESVQFI